MSRGILLSVLGAAFAIGVASTAAANPGGVPNGGVGQGNGNGNADPVVTAPEINRAGLAAAAALLLGGVALITARSGARKDRAAHG